MPSSVAASSRLSGAVIHGSLKKPAEAGVGGQLKQAKRPQNGTFRDGTIERSELRFRAREW